MAAKQELVQRENVVALREEAPVPSFSFVDMQRMAVAVAKSNLFGVKDADQALSLMMIAQADGIHPATAARDYSIIQGRPAKKAEAILRDYQRAGGRVEWHERSDKIADATFSHPLSSPIRITWTIDMAKQAGLAGKDNWKGYPRAMLHARCVAEGCRASAPGATGGMYTPEEINDLPPEQQSLTSAVADATGAPDQSEVEGWINGMDVTSLKALETAFGRAWKSTEHAPTRAKYKATYDAMKSQIEEAQARDQEAGA